MSEERRRRQTERMVKEAVANATRKPLWKQSWAVFTALIAIVGSLITVVPRPNLVANDERDPARPLAIIVALSNTTVIPLENIHVALRYNRVETQAGSEISGILITSQVWESSYLGTDERQDIDLGGPRVFGLGPLKTADITVVVEYQPWFIPWTRSKSWRFRGFPRPDGTFRLMAVPNTK